MTKPLGVREKAWNESDKVVSPSRSAARITRPVAIHPRAPGLRGHFIAHLTSSLARETPVPVLRDDSPCPVVYVRRYQPCTGLPLGYTVRTRNPALGPEPHSHSSPGSISTFHSAFSSRIRE